MRSEGKDASHYNVQPTEPPGALAAPFIGKTELRTKNKTLRSFIAIEAQIECCNKSFPMQIGPWRMQEASACD